MAVLSLHKPRPCDDVAETLRRIASDIDDGTCEWPVTTAVVVLGHTDAEVFAGDDVLAQRTYWETFAAGPRTDFFTVRGLLSTVISRWTHEGD